MTLCEFLDGSLYAFWLNRINYIFLMLLTFLKRLAHLEPRKQTCEVGGALLWVPVAQTSQRGTQMFSSRPRLSTGMPFLLSALQVHRALFFSFFVSPPPPLIIMLFSLDPLASLCL